MQKRYDFFRFINIKFVGLFLTLAIVLALTACSSLIRPPKEPPAGDPLGAGLFGLYTAGAVWENAGQVEDLSQQIGREFDIIQWFSDWDHFYDVRAVARVHDQARLPLITWQLSGQSLDAIVSGQHDMYLKGWADGIRKAEGEVYIRLMPEMNGDWVYWNGNPKLFIEVWRYIVDLFEAEGAEYVRWVWAPNITDWPRTDANRLEKYYPGQTYVDVVGLSGFNWGTVRDWSTWRLFDEIYEVPYQRVTSLGNHPIWLAEIASAEQGGDKAAWVKDLLSERNYPKIEAIIWFNEYKEADWRIDSSDASLRAFREWFSYENRVAER